jgi:hypothetical protein
MTFAGIPRIQVMSDCELYKLFHELYNTQPWPYPHLYCPIANWQKVHQSEPNALKEIQEMKTREIKLSMSMEGHTPSEPAKPSDIILLSANIFQSGNFSMSQEIHL